MLGALCPAFGQSFLIFKINLIRHIAKVRVPELPVFHPRKRLQGICRTATFVDAHIEFRSGERTLKPAEKYRDLKRLRILCRRDELIAVVAGVKVEKAVLPAIHLTALVELSACDPDIAVLGFLRDVYKLRVGECYPVQPAKRRQKGYYHRRRGRKSAYRQLPVYHGGESHAERIPLSEGYRRPTEVIRPIPLPLGRDRKHMPLRALRKSQ